MKRFLKRQLPQAAVLACVIATLVSTPVRAELILQYQQVVPSTPPKPFVTTNNVANTTTTFGSTPIQVNISMDVIGLSNQTAFMRFVGVQSTGTATSTFIPALNTTSYDQRFVGMIQFNSLANFTGVNYLTAVFNQVASPANYNVTVKGTGTTSSTGKLTADSHTFANSLVFTSDLLVGPLLQILQGSEDMSLAFNNMGSPGNNQVVLTPNQQTIRAFAASSAGTFAADLASVPEPSTLVGAAVAGLVVLGLSRRRRPIAA